MRDNLIFTDRHIPTVFFLTHNRYVKLKDFVSLQDLPSTQHPEVFGMHENVDISKDLQQTKLLFDSLILTQGGGSKGGGSSGGDNNLLDIASDILSKVITHTM